MPWTFLSSVRKRRKAGVSEWSLPWRRKPATLLSRLATSLRRSPCAAHLSPRSPSLNFPRSSLISRPLPPLPTRSSNVNAAASVIMGSCRKPRIRTNPIWRYSSGRGRISTLIVSNPDYPPPLEYATEDHIYEEVYVPTWTHLMNKQSPTQPCKRLYPSDPYSPDRLSCRMDGSSWALGWKRARLGLGSEFVGTLGSVESIRSLTPSEDGEHSLASSLSPPTSPTTIQINMNTLLEASLIESYIYDEVPYDWRGTLVEPEEGASETEYSNAD